MAPATQAQSADVSETPTRTLPDNVASPPSVQSPDDDDSPKSPRDVQINDSGMPLLSGYVRLYPATQASSDAVPERVWLVATDLSLRVDGGRTSLAADDILTGRAYRSDREKVPHSINRAAVEGPAPVARVAARVAARARRRLVAVAAPAQGLLAPLAPLAAVEGLAPLAPPALVCAAHEVAGAEWRQRYRRRLAPAAGLRVHPRGRHAMGGGGVGDGDQREPRRPRARGRGRALERREPIARRGSSRQRTRGEWPLGLALCGRARREGRARRALERGRVRRAGGQHRVGSVGYGCDEVASCGDRGPS